MKKTILFTIFLAAGLAALSAQPWAQDNSVFNPSGIPSLTFSQPRFADLDADGDQDFFLGNINRSPVYVQNTGTASSPAFAVGTDLAGGISALASEMAVCADLDNDGDLDLVTGGYTGLHLFQNTGTPALPAFAEAPGYFQGLSVGSNPVPDLADVDNDGDLDMVVGLSEDGGVRLYTNIGTASAALFSQAAMQTIGDIGLYAYPVFCDLDNDSDQDILCGRDLHGFVYYQNTGSAASPVWEENSALFSGLGMEDYWNSPDLVDLTGDGLYDLVFGTASGPLQYYVNSGSAASPVWQANTALFGGVIDVGGASSPFFFDFDADGDLDMFSGTQLGYIKYFENTGTVHSPGWEEDSAFFSVIDHSIYAAVTVGDVDADGLPDLIVGDLNGTLFFHRNTGLGLVEQTGVLPPISLGGWSVPRLLDMDGDGDLDLATGCEAGTLRYYENQGTPAVPNWVEVTNYFAGIDVGSNSSPSFGDVDGDGDIDFVAGNMWGEVKCYLRGGLGWTLDNALFAGIETGQNAAPALADLDHDGDLDLTLGDYDGTFGYWRNLMYSGAVLNPPQNLSIDISNNVLLLWEPPAPGSTSPFEHYQVWLDGVFQGGTGELSWIFDGLSAGEMHVAEVISQYVAGESVPAVLEFSLAAADDPQQPTLALSNFPNPFNPSTTISFSVDGPNPASLTIFNGRGQAVKSWNGLAPGLHRLVWDGRDDQGNPLSSGIYLYRLDAGTRTQSRKMLLLK